MNPQSATTPNLGDTVNIGLWGGTSSGKSTFIGAANIATMMPDLSGWTMDDLDEPGYERSGEYRSELFHLLSRRFFPRDNEREERILLGYLLGGQLYHDKIEAMLKKGWPTSVINAAHRILTDKRVYFTLRFWDYGGSSLQWATKDKDLPNYLANCDGIVFLFDPVRERGFAEEQQLAPDDNGEEGNFTYLQDALSEMRKLLIYQRISGKQMIDNHVPQYLSVCTTKADDPSVFKPLVEKGIVRVPGNNFIVDDPKQAFFSLADLYTQSFVNSFLPRRTNYFVTSSVGFARDTHGNIDWGFVRDQAGRPILDENNRVQWYGDEYRNSLKDANGRPYVIDRVRPMNVIEPLLWIYTQVELEREDAKKNAKKQR